MINNTDDEFVSFSSLLSSVAASAVRSHFVPVGHAFDWNHYFDDPELSVTVRGSALLLSSTWTSVMAISPSAFPSSAEAYEHRVDVWPRVLPLASVSAALLQFVSILPLEAKRGQTRSPSDVFGGFLLHVCPPLAKCMEKSSLLLSGNSISSQG